MSSHASTDLTIDPTEKFHVSVHPDDLATTVWLNAARAGASRLLISCDHFNPGHTPEAFVAWLRSVADATEAAWAAKRQADAYPEPLVQVALP